MELETTVADDRHGDTQAAPAPPPPPAPPPQPSEQGYPPATAWGSSPQPGPHTGDQWLATQQQQWANWALAQAHHQAQAQQQWANWAAYAGPHAAWARPQWPWPPQQGAARGAWQQTGPSGAQPGERRAALRVYEGLYDSAEGDANVEISVEDHELNDAIDNTVKEFLTNPDADLFAECEESDDEQTSSDSPLVLAPSSRLSSESTAATTAAESDLPNGGPTEVAETRALLSRPPNLTVTDLPDPPPPPQEPTLLVSTSEAARRQAAARIKAAVMQEQKQKELTEPQATARREAAERALAMAAKTKGRSWQKSEVIPPPEPVAQPKAKERPAPPEPPPDPWAASANDRAKAEPKEKPNAKAKAKAVNSEGLYTKEVDELAVGVLKVLQEFPQGLLLSQVKPHLQARAGMQFSPHDFGVAKLQEVFLMPPLDTLFPLEMVPDRNEIMIKAPNQDAIPPRLRQKLESYSSGGKKARQYMPKEGKGVKSKNNKAKGDEWDQWM